jgi:Sulfotransferase domain
VSLNPLAWPVYRRLRFGRPIIIVSGLPRSGTSMMMTMLAAGGLEVVTDRVREADESNPNGYFELERVLTLDKDADKGWLREARGRAVKIISALLPHVPAANNYRVIFMHRELQEVIASQNAMLVRRGGPAGTAEDDERMRGLFEAHLRKIRGLIERRAGFEVLHLDYGEVVRQPLVEARRVAAFLGGGLDARRMAEAVDPALHRNRLD